MAEIQTVVAALELARIASEVYQFLRKAKNADKIVCEVRERLNRLRAVLHGVETAVERRADAPDPDPEDLEIIKRIRKCIDACKVILNDIKHRTIDKSTEGYNDDDSDIDPLDNTARHVHSIFDRVKVALQQSGTLRRQADLEARITALQTELALLQLSGQARTDRTLGKNHNEIVTALSALSNQVNVGNKLVKQMFAQLEALARDGHVSPHDEDDRNAIENLSTEVRRAEEVHERLTTEYNPDALSDIRGELELRTNLASPPVAMTPAAEVQSDASQSGDPLTPAGEELSELTTPVDFESDEDIDDDSLPLPNMIEDHVLGYVEESRKNEEGGRYQQAEWNLHQAIRWAQIAEKRYSIPFKERHARQEEVAILYLKQHKFGEAVRIVSELLREDSDEQSYARQHQLLASIYHDRHSQRPGSLSLSRDDIEEARRHAMKAFNRRFSMNPTEEQCPEEYARHQDCIRLLVRILQTQDRPVEAGTFEKLLSEREGSISSGARTSVSGAPYPTTTFDKLAHVDTHQSLTIAIEENDVEFVMRLLAEENIKIDRPCRHGFTPLMYAVQHCDEGIVHKLLSREVGADVNAQNKKGITALHRAADLGRADMIHCLLKYEADLELTDKDGETALIKAVRKDQRKAILMLAEHGANMAAKGRQEWSLLHFAIHLPTTSTTDLILTLSPNLKDALDDAGKTALHHCAEDPKLLEQARTLLEHKNHADLNAIDSVSRTPLYLAASHPPTPKRENMVALLVDHGASLGDEDRLPPRWRDYPQLARKKLKPPVRHDSGTSIGGPSSRSTRTDTTTSSARSKWSRMLPGRKHPKSGD